MIVYSYLVIVSFYVDFVWMSTIKKKKKKKKRQLYHILFEAIIYALFNALQFLLVSFPTTEWPSQVHKNETLPEFQAHNYHHGSHIFQWLQVPGNNVAERDTMKPLSKCFVADDPPLLL